MEPALVIYSGLVMTNRLFLVKFSRTYFESSEAIPSKLIYSYIFFYIIYTFLINYQLLVQSVLDIFTGFFQFD